MPGAPEKSETSATMIGAAAIMLWSFLALFTSYAQGIPPFQLLTLSFSIAFVVGMLVLWARRRPIRTLLRQDPRAWILGIAGLFGFHAFYFIALAEAPVVEASLIAYLWPLLIVLFSALLPQERLRSYHLAGAFLGFLGAALLIVKDGGGFSFDARYTLGYLAAFGCALTWSGYSVLNRRFSRVPTDLVTFFCLAVAILGLIVHLLLEETVTPNVIQALAILGLGLGPVGLAFYVWDYGVKHGAIQLLGILAYLAPLLSTLLLVLFGKAEAEWRIALASLLIVGGALAASKEVHARLVRLWRACAGSRP